MIKEAINIWIESVRADVIKNYDAKNMRASGNFEKQLKTFYSESKNKYTTGLIGTYYAYWMENGRKPTAPNKRGRLYGIMLEWVKQKKITTDESEQKRIAYFVGKKIDEKGYAPRRIISEAVTDAKKQELQKALGKLYAIELKNTIWQLQQ